MPKISDGRSPIRFSVNPVSTDENAQPFKVSRCSGPFAADYVSRAEERVHQSGAVHHLLSRRLRGVSGSAGKGVTETLTAVAVPGETTAVPPVRGQCMGGCHGWV